MIDIFVLLTVFTALGLLVTLAVIDFKTYLLPNIYVFPFATAGVLFHVLTEFNLLDIREVIIGGVAGYGILFLIRAAGNKYYKQDSLGLGDVKLLGAAGLWLGLDGVLISMTLGALLGLFHGLTYAFYISVKTKEKISIARLAIPAGPGFCLAIIIAFIWLYQDFLIRMFYELFA